MVEKQEIRQRLRDQPDWPAGGLGRLAERLRRLPEYRRAGQLFVTPGPLLRQVRINALVDGKLLLMPAPGLQKGFYLLTPYTIPFPALAQAVSLAGAPAFGKRLARPEGLRIGLLVTDPLVVDGQGTMVDSGQGFFDLAAAILAACGCLSDQARVVAVCRQRLGSEETIAADPWDVAADLVLTPGGEERLPGHGADWPALHWQLLPAARIKRITPLFQLAPRP